jgi:hypothetical protein
MSEHHELTPDVIAARSNAVQMHDRVIFAVKALYGLSRQSIRVPLNESEGIESGQVCTTIDPEADETANIGVINFAAGTLRVRYGVQIVFPGLFRLVNEEKFEPSLLDPVRATATDDCSVEPDHSGWHAMGCLEFLPGSPWAGASGG